MSEPNIAPRRASNERLKRPGIKRIIGFTAEVEAWHEQLPDVLGMLDSARVLEDVLDEKVTPGAAARDYGVVIDLATRSVNTTRTAILRERQLTELTED
ncbi:MAG: hypothetical protein ACLQBA_20650 [Candidatus Binataceae bacterium]